MLNKNGINVKTYRKISLIFTLLLTIATSLSAASPSEIDGLVAFYDSTDGDNWRFNDNWKDGDPCDNNWYGVSCVDGDVTVIYLNSNNLRGSLPTEIGNLTNLFSLILYYNSLTGSIPATIGDLTNLSYLDLHLNSLTGSIPTEIGLTSLSYFYFGNNQLTGIIPTEIGNLTNLTHLSLYENKLRGSIPEEIGNLTN